MLLSTLSAAMIANWEAETGPSPIHGLGLELESGGTIEVHSHHRGQIMTAPAGVVTVRTNGRSFLVAGKKGVWIPEGAPHEVIASTEVKLRNLQISRALAPHLPVSVCPITVSSLFGELLRSAIEQLELGEMPPDDDALAKPDRAKLIVGLKQTLALLDSDVPALRDPGPAPLLRTRIRRVPACFSPATKARCGLAVVRSVFIADSVVRLIVSVG